MKTVQPKILIIDDEESVRRFLRFSLLSHDYEVSEASTGFQGLEIAARDKHDAILLDLLARLRVAQRHRYNSESQPIFKASQLEVDFLKHEVKVQGYQIKLTATEFDLLKILIRNAGRAVTQKQILLEVWGHSATENSHYLRIYIGHLRKKFEDATDLPKLIITEPGIGYRFVLTQD